MRNVLNFLNQQVMNGANNGWQRMLRWSRMGCCHRGRP
jgi:hypothetical protein